MTTTGDEQLTIEASHYYELNKEKFVVRNELDWDSLLDRRSIAENAPTLLNRAIGLYPEELHPVLEDYIVCQKPDLSILEVQFSPHYFPLWFNPHPHAKIQELKKIINYDMVPLEFIPLYPSKEVLLSDKIFPDTNEYFVLKDEISACGWGPAYQFISGNNGTSKWIKAELLKER